MSKYKWKYTDEDGNTHYDCDWVAYLAIIEMLFFLGWFCCMLIEIFVR